MAYYTLETDDAPLIEIVSVAGNLEVKGWERDEISVKTSDGRNPFQETPSGSVRITADANCSVHVPIQSNLRIERVDGNASLKLIEGIVKIDVVHGKLGVRDSGAINVDMVHGDLWINNLAGDLLLDVAHGNAVVRNVVGSCNLGQVTGNLNIRDVEGDIRAVAAGNIRLRLSHTGGEQYQLSSGGNTNCKVPLGASLSVGLTSGSGQILVRTPQVRNTYNTHNYSLTLADGLASMQLTSGANITFESHETDLSDLEDLEDEFAEAFAGISAEYTDEIASQIEEQIEAQMEIINEQMANLSETISRAGLSDEQIERVMNRARAAGERVTERAQARMRRAQEKMERKLAATKRRADLKAQAAERRSKIKSDSGSYQWSGPSGDTPPASPVSDEERLMILRMLEAKLSLIHI